MSYKIRNCVQIFLLLILSLTLTGCLTRSALVKFESNGGTPVRDIMVPYGQLLEEPDEPTKNGYNFAGWHRDIDLTLPYEFSNSVEENFSLYAKWEPAKYQITWETNGGLPIDPSQINYKASLTLPTPTRGGYVFGGWYYEEDFINIIDPKTTMPAEDFTLYARWSKGNFRVSFNTNGGLLVDPIDGEFDTNFDAPLTNKLGHVFQGWYLEEEFINEFTEFIIPAKDTILYAKWEPLDLEVTFFHYEGKKVNVDVKYGQAVEEPNSPTREGYTFKAWRKDGEVYDFSDPVVEDIIIQAEWEVNEYIVNFDTLGGSLIDSLEIAYDNLIKEVPKTTRTGYEFGGWYQGLDYTEVWDFSKDRVKKDLTLYAKWNIKSYTINFITGTDPIPPITQEYNSSLTSPAEPEREGFTFKGWYRDSNHSILFEFPETMPAENLTLYAKWDNNEYKIEYYLEGDLHQTVFVLFDENIIPLTAPLKTGYTFTGWNALPEQMPASDLEIHGSYTINYYSLTYYLDGEVYKTLSLAYDSIIAPLSAPLKTGYTFTGWDLPEQMPANDLEAHGSYTINSYELIVETSDELRGEVLVSPDTSPISYQTEVSVSALPFVGYKFSHWLKNGEVFSTKAVDTFSMPALNLILTAVFVPESNVSYTVNYYGEDLDGALYQLLDSITLQGTTEEVVNANIRAFAGFTFNEDVEDNLLQGIILGDGSLELAVYYSRNTYLISYYLDDQVIETQTYKYQEAIIALPNPSKTGYTFTGWNLPEQMPASDLEIHGSYTINYYSLTYYLDGEVYKTLSLAYDSIIAPLSAPLKTGYTFTGWDLPEQMPANDLEAHGSYTINSYELIVETSDELRGEVLVSPDTSPLSYQTEVSVSALPFAGYKFSHWLKNGEVFSTKAVDTFSMPALNLILTAVFVPESNVSYTVNYYGESLDGVSYLLLDSITLQGTTEEVVNANIRAFAGFTFNEDYEDNLLQGIILGDGSLSLAVYYSRNTYLVSYYLDDQEYETQTYKYQEVIFALPNPSKTGYTFTGWNLPEQMPANDLEIHGSYTINYYSLTYYLDGEVYKTLSLAYDSIIAPLSAPLKTGYTFTGWDLPEQMPANDLEAHGAYTINSYELIVETSDELRGEVLVSPDTSPLSYQTEVSVSALPFAGYKFSHWLNNGEVFSTKAVDTFSMPALNLILTAVFVPESNVSYTVNYYGESLDGASYLLLDSITLQGTTEEVVNANIRAFAGFTFNEDYEDNLLQGIILGDGSLSLAVYYSRNTYLISYYLDDQEYETQTYKYQEAIIALPNPSKTGYTFTGWNLPEQMPANDLEIHGTFSLIEYQITYQLNEGKFSLPQPNTYNITSSFVILNPTKLGYTFLGWTTEAILEPIRDFQINVGNTGAVHLVANWKEIKYSIEYFDGASLLSLLPDSYFVTSEVVLPLPEKLGYSFLGWYDNSEFLGDSIILIEEGNIGNKTYYAKFALDTYLIYYYDEDLKLINNPNLINEYTYNDIYDLDLVMLERTGYSFTWVDANRNPVQAIPSGTVGEILLYAEYTLNSYDISFYHENGDLIGTIYNIAYNSEITLNMAFVGRPLDVARLIELNLNIIYLNLGLIDTTTFYNYFIENASLIAAISEDLSSSVSHVMTEQSLEAIAALLQASELELAFLSQALNIKISLLQDLKNMIEDVVNGGDGNSLYLYVYAAKGAYTSYSDELSNQINLWLEANGSDMDAFESMNSMVSFELNTAARLRKTYQKNHPTKGGYAFLGWKIGSNTLYLTHGEGYLFEGIIVMAPSSLDEVSPAKLIAVYKRLQACTANFNAANNLLSWEHLLGTELESLYNPETETIEYFYQIYIEDEAGNISYYESTQLNQIVLEIVGTYKVRVIPVVKIYENGELINTITASIPSATSKEVVVKKTEDEALLESSGNYYHKATEGGQTVYYFFSNTEITFPNSKFTILSGSEYVEVARDNTLIIGSSYTNSENVVEFTFTASDGGSEYLGRIYPYISQYELGTSLIDYQTTTREIDDSLYYNKEITPYYVGKASFGVDSVDVLGNNNAFYFNLLVKTTGGKSVELPATYLKYTAFEIIDEVETEVIISNNTAGDWQIYLDGNAFYFREDQKMYKISIEIKDLYVPKALKEDGIITPKSFIITTNDATNVFTNEELKIAYANTIVKAINIHSDIEASLNDDQIYEQDGTDYPYNFYATNVIELHQHNLAMHSGNVYQRISTADPLNPDNLVINGNYFTIDGSNLPYTNYQPSSEAVIQIPNTDTELKQAGGLNTAAGYKIRDVQIAIFNHIALDSGSPAKVNYGGVTYNNLTIIGNTRTPNVNYSEGSGQIEEALEIMGKNSGGYMGIANNFNLTLDVDNVVIGSTTIAIWSNTETIVDVNNAHLYNSWANTIYFYGGASLSVQNSVLETSGGAAIHLEDSKFSSDYQQSIYFDTSSVEVNNWVSGEEPWFKAYKMELAAMQMKSQINSSVSSNGASILRNITDLSTGLVSRKMNFTLLLLPVVQQLSPTEADKAGIDSDKHTLPGYSDAILKMYQSEQYYGYEVPYLDGYLITLSGQSETAMPFGQIRTLMLDTGISDLGNNIYTNYLAVPLDLTSVDRGYGVVMVGLDNQIN